MNVSSCQDIIKLAHPSGTMSADLIHVILPNICSIIDSIPPANVSVEETLFYKFCCDPIPTMILNRTVLLSDNNTGPSKFIYDVCSYMDGTGQNRDEALYQDLCVPTAAVSVVLDPMYQLLTILVLSLLSPVGLFANILILLTVYKVKRLRNTTGYFICNLAIADLLTIFTMILYVLRLYVKGMKSASRLFDEFFLATLDAVIGSASLLHVTAVSFERCIAVSMPLKYVRHRSKRTANKIITGIWGYCLLLLLLGLLRIAVKSSIYHDIFFFFAATLSFFIPCILFIVSYAFILISALSNMKEKKKKISMMNDQENLKITLTRSARFREIKIACNVAIMTVPFVFGWGYFMTCNLYEFVSKNEITGFQNWLIAFVPFIISCLNPLTYLVSTQSLRKSALQLFSRSTLYKKLLVTTEKETIATTAI